MQVEQQMILNANDWDYLNEGDLHFICTYIGSEIKFQNTVLILEKEDHKYEIKQKWIQQNSLLNEAHQYILSRFQPVQCHLLKRQHLKLKNKKQFIDCIMLRIDAKKSKTRKVVHVNYDASVILAQHLLKPLPNPELLQQIFIEFKPKSCIEDVYNLQEIADVSKQLGVSSQTIINILEKSNSQERTKYTKKQILKLNSGNKIHPHQIFGYQVSNVAQTALIYKQYGHKIIDSQTVDKIVNTILDQSRILKGISALQLLYTKPFALINNFDFETIRRIVPPECDNILAQINKCYDQYSQQVFKRPEIIVDDKLEGIIDILKFLISCTWRDVSLILKLTVMENNAHNKQNTDIIQINHQYIVAYKITVIDYCLKPLSRVKSSPQKQKDILSRYIKYKFSQS